MSNPNSYLKVKDFSVSRESFELIPNKEFGFLETAPRPSASELAKYYESKAYISHTDASRTLFEKGYQFVRSIALKRKLKLINSFSFNTKTLLDYGAGTGDFLKIALDDQWKVYGIEPNDGARAIANTKTKDRVFKVGELKSLEQGSFDVITLWHVLEHVMDLEQLIMNLKGLLKPNGTLIIAVPNYYSFDAQYYKSFWAAYDVPRHLWHFSQASMQKLMFKYGLQLEQILPMYFDAYYVSLLSEKYKTGCLNPLKAFWIAWRSNRRAKKTNEYSSLIYILKQPNN